MLRYLEQCWLRILRGQKLGYYDVNDDATYWTSDWPVVSPSLTRPSSFVRFSRDSHSTWPSWVLVPATDGLNDVIRSRDSKCDAPPSSSNTHSHSVVFGLKRFLSITGKQRYRIEAVLARFGSRNKMQPENYTLMSLWVKETKPL